NAIILSIMSMFWFFGVFGIIIYSIIVFNLAKKYMDDINIKYNKLLKSTNAIAQGNLSIEINEDLGVLNPLKEEVEKIQSGFKKAVEKEVKSEKMKTELISNVSHDLKTPLTSIITYVDLLKDDTLSNEKKKQYLDVLDRKSQSLQYLIEDLFEISKVNSKNISLNITNVDLVYLMKQTILELDHKIKERDLKIKTNFNKDKILCPLDSQRTFRIFENLITNIIKYSLESSRVYIDILERDKNIEITLKNIAKEEIDFNSKDIIERFVRGDKSRNAEGSGLGLAIAKSFVEVQGGTFHIVLDGDLFKVIIKFSK
ncbi:MAG: sensor histidine kinase, partial [Clostridium perfringens]|nr:sensor histidine kinase [Clostridium perfringens]